MVGSSEAHEERDNEYVPKLVWVPGGMRRRWATTGRMDETCPTILWRSQVSEKDVTSASKHLTKWKTDVTLLLILWRFHVFQLYQESRSQLIKMEGWPQPEKNMVATGTSTWLCSAIQCCSDRGWNAKHCEGSALCYVWTLGWFRGPWVVVWLASWLPETGGDHTRNEIFFPGYPYPNKAISWFQ